MEKKDKQIVRVDKEIKSDKDYQYLLKELKSIIAKGQYAAYKALDNILVQTYWQIGERIVREELKHKNRADYGKYLIENLAVDLGIKRRRLYEIIKFYHAYTIVRSVSAQLSWTHYITLIGINNSGKRAFYQKHAISHSWSVRELKKHIKNNLYENTSQKEIEEILKTKFTAVDTQKVFKNTYDFQFIELKSKKDEKEFENRIINNFEKFLKELGEDFSILGAYQ